MKALSLYYLLQGPLEVEQVWLFPTVLCIHCPKRFQGRLHNGQPALRMRMVSWWGLAQCRRHEKYIRYLLCFSHYKSNFFFFLVGKKGFHLQQARRTRDLGVFARAMSPGTTKLGKPSGKDARIFMRGLGKGPFCTGVGAKVILSRQSSSPNWMKSLQDQQGSLPTDLSLQLVPCSKTQTGFSPATESSICVRSVFTFEIALGVLPLIYCLHYG